MQFKTVQKIECIFDFDEMKTLVGVCGKIGGSQTSKVRQLTDKIYEEGCRVFGTDELKCHVDSLNIVHGMSIGDD